MPGQILIQKRKEKLSRSEAFKLLYLKIHDGRSTLMQEFEDSAHLFERQFSKPHLTRWVLRLDEYVDPAYLRRHFFAAEQWLNDPSLAHFFHDEARWAVLPQITVATCLLLRENTVYSSRKMSLERAVRREYKQHYKLPIEDLLFYLGNGTGEQRMLKTLLERIPDREVRVRIPVRALRVFMRDEEGDEIHCYAKNGLIVVPPPNGVLEYAPPHHRPNARASMARTPVPGLCEAFYL